MLFFYRISHQLMERMKVKVWEEGSEQEICFET